MTIEMLFSRNHISALDGDNCNADSVSKNVSQIKTFSPQCGFIGMLNYLVRRNLKA